MGPNAKVALERCILEGIDGLFGTFYYGTWGPGAGITVEGEASLGNSSVIGGTGYNGFYDGIHSVGASPGEDAARVTGAGGLALRNSYLEGGRGGDGYYEWGCKSPGTG